ncbi:Uncharacterised protein [Mycobacteroides abscessus subsp. massiliense]|nr:Uncharacterised protein [Mycobacteroides abscessus subsp. massiliense]
MALSVWAILDNTAAVASTGDSSPEVYAATSSRAVISVGSVGSCIAVHPVLVDDIQKF